MARSRQEILDDLMNQSQSDPILGSVMSSLVGRELLYFGANVIYQIENFGSSISNFRDIARADFEQLIAYAYTHDVPCDTTKPAIVTLTLHNVPETVYRPFEICLHVGSCNFYNIDFVTSTQQIQLYQGTPHAVRSSEGVELDAFGVATGLGTVLLTKTWTLYKEFVEGKYQSAYIKLGDLAISDSVRVFARPSAEGSDTIPITFPYTEFNQQLASPSAKLYKVRTGWDKSINVLFGDDNWAQAIAQDTYNYEVYFLEATLLNYTLSNRDTLYLGYRQEGGIKNQPIDGAYYTVNSFTGAERDSLPFAKSFVQTKMFFQLGLVTEQQITNYLNVLPSVNSSSVLVTDNGAIQVYLKPTDPNNKAFGFVEDYLYQYGVAGTTYKVDVAKPVNFSVKLSPIGVDGLMQLARAQQLIDEYCAYDRLTITSRISSAILQQQLQLYGINSVTAVISVEREAVEVDANNTQVLAALPAINTVKQYTEDGELIGYDANGVYYAITKAIGTAPIYVSRIGDFIFVCVDTGSVQKSWVLTYDRWGDAEDQQRWYGVETTELLVNGPDRKPVVGKVMEFVDDVDDINIISGDTIYQYSAGPFRKGQGSILHQQIILTPSKTFSLRNSVDMNAPTAFVNTNVYYSLVGSTALYKESMLAGAPPVSGPLQQSTPNPFFVSDDVLYSLPTPGEQNGFAYNLKSESKQENFRLSSGSVPLGRSGTLLDARSDGNTVISLVKDGENIILYRSRFVPGPQAYLVAESYPIKFPAESSTPAKIVSTVAESVVVSSKSGDVLWRIDAQGNIWKADTRNAALAEDSGTISYTEGKIFNMPSSEGNTFLSYEVAGTIGAVGRYPNYVKE